MARFMSGATLGPGGDALACDAPALAGAVVGADGTLELSDETAGSAIRRPSATLAFDGCTSGSAARGGGSAPPHATNANEATNGKALRIKVDFIKLRGGEQALRQPSLRDFRRA